MDGKPAQDGIGNEHELHSRIEKVDIRQSTIEPVHKVDCTEWHCAASREPEKFGWRRSWTAASDGMNQESFGLWSRDDLEAWEMHDWSQPGDDVNRALRHKVPDAAAIRFKSWS
jgi:hypothetical protein